MILTIIGILIGVAFTILYYELIRMIDKWIEWRREIRLTLLEELRIEYFVRNQFAVGSITIQLLNEYIEKENKG